MIYFNNISNNYVNLPNQNLTNMKNNNVLDYYLLKKDEVEDLGFHIFFLNNVKSSDERQLFFDAFSNRMTENDWIRFLLATDENFSLLCLTYNIQIPEEIKNNVKNFFRDFYTVHCTSNE